MSVGHYHALCHRHMGKAVEIRTHDGRVHRGVIHRVTPTHVYLQPIGGPRNLGGFGFGFWGWGFGAGIALGAIAGLAILPWFFW
ncbi:MAG TPA: hypothetical protein GXX18_08305 [Bacillales bacterium]|nr:hypothetical protein [Bacillales bacterium]